MAAAAAAAAAPPLIISISTIFAALSFLSSAIALSDIPFILAHKKATLTKLHRASDEERVSVTIDIYNSGPITAYDVSVVDDTWPSEIFDLVTGNTSNSWKTLESGSHVSHSFELVPKWRTVYLGAPALIKFRVPLKSRLQEAYSTPTLALHTLADEVKTDKLQLVKNLLAKYGSHISVILIVGAFAHTIFFLPKSNAGDANKKKH